MLKEEFTEMEKSLKERIARLENRRKELERVNLQIFKNFYLQKVNKSRKSTKIK